MAEARQFPTGSEEGRRLFAALLAMAEHGQFDDDFLEALVAYRGLYPASEKFDIFFAQYALAHGNAAVALEHGRLAEKRRPLNYRVWRLLAESLCRLGKNGAALMYEGFSSSSYGKRFDVEIDREDVADSLASLSKAMGLGNYAPFMSSWLVMTEKGLEERRHTLVGDFLPLGAGGKTDWWVGVYTEAEPLNAKGWLVEQHKEDEQFLAYCGADFVFDFQRAMIASERVAVEEAAPVVFPLAGLTAEQPVTLAASGKVHGTWLGKWEYSYYRLDAPTEIRAEAPFICGAPVLLRHSGKRRRVILNVLLDGLCWREMQRQDYRYVPNLIRFFSQGIIFSDHFSVAEYTYPSLPTIKTGMYPHHSQIFNKRISYELSPAYRTLSEQMKALGYYCVSLIGDGTGIFCGCDRGFDRMIVNSYARPTYIGVERAIRQMEAFSDTDQYLFVHTMDTHPWAVRRHSIPLAAQTRLSLEDRLAGADDRASSVYLPHAPLYMCANQQGIAAADRSLGALFDYLTSHYDEDEYIVQVFSDHGVPIYDEHPYVLSENQLGAALMMRGANIPALGFVDELTSAVDMYPIMARHAGFEVPAYCDGNLPAALGGRAREYAVSESVYPGQTYKLALWTKQHEFQLESKWPVDEDGTVDLTAAAMRLWTRDEKRAVRDEGIWQEFLARAEAFTASFNDEGHYWPEMKAARSLWFEGMPR